MLRNIDVKTTLLALAAALLTSTASAQALAVCDASTTHKRIMLYDAVTGSLINKDFITSPGPGYAFSRPRKVISVGTELWVVDQGQGRIFRFTQSGTFISAITGLTNPRGGSVVNGVVYVTNSAAPPGIDMYDFSGNALGSFATTGTTPYDVIPFNSDVLVSDLGNDNIHRYSTAGTDLGSFTNATNTITNRSRSRWVRTETSSPRDRPVPRVCTSTTRTLVTS